MADIDRALASAQLTPGDQARVVQLRREGDELHVAGDHARSEAALYEARRILGL